MSVYQSKKVLRLVSDLGWNKTGCQVVLSSCPEKLINQLFLYVHSLLMDKKNICKLPVEEKEFFLNSEKNDNWVQTLFAPYNKPLSIGIGIQNQFIDNVNQTVSQWKNHVRFKKLTSFTRLKRNFKHKIYVTLIGPFPDFFYSNNEFNIEFKNCIKTFLESFFPGIVVTFLPIVDHKDLKVATRIHEKSNQTQLFLPDIKMYLQKNIPKDALCSCGFSWFDFFPSYELNHILGEGSIEHGTAAFTFGHYALFKERELFQASIWKGDYAIERPYNISDGLCNEKEGFYDFVTENEKEEAKIFTLECDQEGCAGSKLAVGSQRIRIKSPLTLKGFFKQRKTSNASSMQSNTSHESEEMLVASASAVVEAPSELNLTVPHSSTYCSEEVKQQQPAVMEPVVDEVLDAALPTNTEFTLDCKILRRLFRVMSHEICHVLGMTHCQYFSCTMNTSSSVLHTDTQPLLLCPVCLRKLQVANGFRIKERYESLLQFLLLHTEVCDAPGLHREEVIRMEETQMLSSHGDVCLFKNDVQTILCILEVLREKSENFGFETVEAADDD